MLLVLTYVILTLHNVLFPSFANGEIEAMRDEIVCPWFYSW